MFFMKPTLQAENQKSILPALKKEIGLFEVIVYGVGIILGAGIYTLIGKTAGIAGNSLWLAFMVAAITASFTALSYAELSSRFPKEAAEMVYAKNAFRSNFLAFLVGYFALFSMIVGIPVVALGFAGYLIAFLQGLGFVFTFLSGSAIMALFAISIIVLMSALNLFGLKESAKFNLVSTIIEAGGLILIVIISIPFLGSVNYFEVPPGSTDFVAPIAAAAALIFFAYIGFEDLANIAEEVKDAEKNIPKAMIIAMILTTLLYIAVSFAAVSVVSWRELAESASPIELIASHAFGGQAGLLLSAVALFATANTVLILLIVSSRMICGMAREQALPDFLGRINTKTSTPFYAIVLTMLVAISALFFSEIDNIARLTNAGIFLVFFAVNASLIAIRAREFREKDCKNKAGFRVPINFANIPLLSVAGALFCVMMLFQFTAPITIYGFTLPLLGFALLFLLTGIPVYLLFAKRKNWSVGR